MLKNFISLFQVRIFVTQVVVSQHIKVTHDGDLLDSGTQSRAVEPRLSVIAFSRSDAAVVEVEDRIFSAQVRWPLSAHLWRADLPSSSVSSGSAPLAEKKVSF